MQSLPVRSYYKDNVLMPREYGEGYMSDPLETAEKVVRMIALHDNLKVNPSNITVGHSFDDLGLNELDMAEIYLMIEKEYDFEISEDLLTGLKPGEELVDLSSAFDDLNLGGGEWHPGDNS